MTAIAKGTAPVAFLAAAFLCSVSARAQNMAAAPVTAPGAAVLDRVVAVVNGDVLLQSDVDEELRFNAIEPFHPRAAGSAEQQALRRLIDRTLILQQVHQLRNPVAVSDADLHKQIRELRARLPVCADEKCAGDADWRAVLAAHGFTEAAFAERWHQRMLVLAFIEQRFRNGIRISKPEVQAYYTKSFLPEFEKDRLTAPPLAAVSARIDELLLQQHVNGLLTEWLSSLKNEGSVAILDPRYAQAAAATGIEDKADSAAGDDE